MLFQGSEIQQMGMKVPQVLFPSRKCKIKHSKAHVDKKKNNTI
jgi:hypothetical protein